MATTPYMFLTLPDPTVTPGPTYASQNNTAFLGIDSHDHTSGKGVLIPSAGIGINADLSFSSFNATNFRSLRLTANASPLALVTDVGCAYRSGDDLWFNDGNGVQIQLTAGGALNAASIGGIGGDYATSTASAFYTNATQKFSFTQNTNQAANMDFGPFTFRNTTASSAGIKFQPNAAISSDYTVTWPAALPSSDGILAVTTSGAISYTSTPTLEELTISGEAMFNGDVNLGSSAADTIDMSGTPTDTLANSVANARTRSTGTSVGIGGIAISNSSGAFSTSSTTAVNVTNMSVTIETAGRPVRLEVIGASATQSDFSITDSDTETGMCIALTRNGGSAFIGQRFYVSQTGAPSTTNAIIPGSSFSHTDTPAAGTYTYQLQIYALSSGGTVGANNLKLTAREL